MGRNKSSKVYTEEERNKIYDYYVHKFDPFRAPAEAGFSIEKLEKEIQEAKDRQIEI